MRQWRWRWLTHCINSSRMNACYHRAPTISMAWIPCIDLRISLVASHTIAVCTNIDNTPLGCLSSLMPIDWAEKNIFKSTANIYNSSFHRVSSPISPYLDVFVSFWCKRYGEWMRQAYFHACIHKNPIWYLHLIHSFIEISMWTYDLVLALCNMCECEYVQDEQNQRQQQ